MASAYETLRGADVVIDFYVSSNAGTGTASDTVVLKVLPKDTDNILGINSMTLLGPDPGVGTYFPAGQGTTTSSGFTPAVFRVTFQACN